MDVSSFSIVSLVVCVHAAEEEVDTEIGDDDTEEGEEAPEVEMHHRMAFARGHVERIEVDEQGDERPDFLRVP